MLWLRTRNSAHLTLSSVVLLLTMLVATPLLAANHQYADPWGDHGITVTREDAGSVELSFSLENWYLGEIEIDGISRQTIQVPGIWLPNEAGAPNVPGVGYHIAVPNGAKASVRILDSRSERFTNIDLGPAPEIPLETDDGLVYPKNDAIYSRDAFYPGNTFEQSAPLKVRGVDAIVLGLSPFQYNPVTQELIVYHDLRLEVTFSGGGQTFGDDRLRSRWWDPILESLL
ncbi:MAG: C25 family peptidase propeptide domain-containing protein, partial [bacterium]